MIQSLPPMLSVSAPSSTNGSAPRGMALGDFAVLLTTIEVDAVTPEIGQINANRGLSSTFAKTSPLMGEVAAGTAFLPVTVPTLPLKGGSEPAFQLREGAELEGPAQSVAINNGKGGNAVGKILPVQDTLLGARPELVAQPLRDEMPMGDGPSQIAALKDMKATGASMASTMDEVELTIFPNKLTDLSTGEGGFGLDDESSKLNQYLSIDLSSSLPGIAPLKPTSLDQCNLSSGLQNDLPTGISTRNNPALGLIAPLYPQFVEGVPQGEAVFVRSSQEIKSVSRLVAGDETGGGPDTHQLANAPISVHSAAGVAATSAPVEISGLIASASQAPVTVISADGATPTADSDLPHDFDLLVSRLAQAREAAIPHVVRTAVSHGEFGRVSMQIGQDDGGLTVALSSHDPEFAGAVRTAASSLLAEQPRQDSATQTLNQSGQNTSASWAQSGGQASRRDGASQGQNSNSQPNGQGRQPQDRQSQDRRSSGDVYA